jgi:hypothetical protein
MAAAAQPATCMTDAGAKFVVSNGMRDGHGDCVDDDKPIAALGATAACPSPV